MDKINNPAERLLQIVNNGKNHNGGRPVIDIWSEILSTSASDYSLLIRRIGYVMDLPSQIKLKIESLGEYDPNIYLKWLPNVENAFKSVHFQMQWSQFISNFDGTVMYGLEVSSDLLSRKSPEPTADNKTLNSILTDLEDLISKSIQVDAPPILKDIILENLIKIKHSIEEYSIRGIIPIQREFNSFLATTVMQNNMDWKPPSEDPFWEKFWKTMARVGIIVSIAASTISIGKDTVKAIEYINKAQSKQHHKSNGTHKTVIDAEVIET